MRIPSFSGVENAANAVAKVALPTPLLTFEFGSAKIFAKAESLQPMGAFKLRGAWWRLVSLSAAERRQLTTLVQRMTASVLAADGMPHDRGP